METRPWINRFVDGGDVDLHFDLEHARVTMTVCGRGEFYHLVFANCTHIYMDYSAAGEDADERDLYNLLNGIEEILSHASGRRFQIEFSDESVLDIACASLSMEPVDVPQYARDVRGGHYP